MTAKRSKTIAKASKRATLRSSEELHAFGYAEGWREAMERAAKMVRYQAAFNLPETVRSQVMDIADRIAAEPVPEKGGR